MVIPHIAHFQETIPLSAGYKRKIILQKLCCMFQKETSKTNFISMQNVEDRIITMLRSLKCRQKFGLKN